MTHFIEKCKHGTVGGQCRCPSPDKMVRSIPCPSHCPKRNDAADPDADAEMLQNVYGAGLLAGSLNDDVKVQPIYIDGIATNEALVEFPKSPLMAGRKWRVTISIEPVTE